MEKIKIQLFKFKNNLLSCQYCDKIMHKSQIALFFYCKCNICIHCKKELTNTYLKLYEYEYFINQNLDHIIINKYFSCPLCCKKTDYNRYNRIIKPCKNKRIKQHNKYTELLNICI